MDETLIIKNFGPIKSVELKLKRFNILIGEQATGKSTVAKLLIAIQNTIFRELFDLLENSSQNRDRNQLFIEYLNITGIQSYMFEDTEIQYHHPAYSFEFKSSIVTVKEFRPLSFEENLGYNFNYIPAERQLITIIANSLFGLTEIGTPLPRLLLRFGNKFNDAKIKQTHFDYTNIMGITYTYTNNKSLVTLSSGKQISIEEASTGLQTSIPLLIVFDNITSNKNNINKSDIKNYLIIEEPELNLFPETQYKLLSHLSKNIALRVSVDKMYYSNQLLLTTHSPYILTSLNNLIYAFQVGQEHTEEVNKIIDKKYWVNPEDVSAYRLMTDGTAKNIVDEELKQIDAGELDEISRSINAIWDKIADIEFSRVDEN